MTKRIFVYSQNCAQRNMASNWEKGSGVCRPVGRYSEVVINSGLTVHKRITLIKQQKNRIQAALVIRGGNVLEIVCE